MAFLGILPSSATPPLASLGGYQNTGSLFFLRLNSTNCSFNPNKVITVMVRGPHLQSLAGLGAGIKFLFHSYYILCRAVHSLYTLFEKQNKRTSINKKWSLMFKPSLSSPKQETPCVRRERKLKMQCGLLSLQKQLGTKFAKVLQRFKK